MVMAVSDVTLYGRTIMYSMCIAVYTVVSLTLSLICDILSP